MFNKNVFTQKDPIADLIKPMLEAQTKAKMEELKGNQAVLDKNKNNKLDAQDFKILRGEKKAVKEEEEQVDESSPFDWKKPREPEVKGGAGVKAGRAYGGAAQKSKPEQDDADDKKKVKEEVEGVDEAAFWGNKELADKMGKAREGGKSTVRDLDSNGKVKTTTKTIPMGGKKKVKEEVEQIDELKKSTLASYTNKASASAVKHQAASDYHGEYGDPDDMEKHDKKVEKRLAGIPKATKRLAKEDVEQIDELSIQTMKSAKEKLGHKAYDAHMDDNKYAARHYATRALNMGNKIKKKERKLAKEEVEQIDERSLTAGETAEKERIVKGMKKGLAGFKARYGDRAKSVMYATATKAAKKD